MTEVVVEAAEGLHARPAAEFVQCAARYESAVTISYGDRLADAKSILAILGLGVAAGDRVRLAASGPDAVMAGHDLALLLAPSTARED